MTPGVRVEVHAAWSSFRGVRGTVTEVKRCSVTGTPTLVMVLLDGERLPIRVGFLEVRVVGETPSAYERIQAAVSRMPPPDIVAAESTLRAMGADVDGLIASGRAVRFQVPPDSERPSVPGECHESEPGCLE